MTIKLEGLDAIVKKIDSLGKPDVFKQPMKESMIYLNDKVAKYPTNDGHRPQPFKTDKSRRWFFWALANPIDSKLEVPYRRGQSPGSKKLGTKWTTKISTDGRRGEIGSDADYGPLVMDKSQQTAYHKQTGWHTIQDVLKKATPTIIGKFKRAYDKAVK